ncbi:hypothetical protein [Arthrobacter antibioticus]|nr:hypothetical protein [Arthrobacter sp. H35-MC1]MDJ0316618.1 hypothetical protein [Arthrobacter sp. H35-MC1]
MRAVVDDDGALARRFKPAERWAGTEGVRAGELGAKDNDAAGLEAAL